MTIAWGSTVYNISRQYYRSTSVRSLFWVAVIEICYSDSPRWLMRWQGMKQDLHSNIIDINPSITHPAHERLYYTTGVLRLLLFMKIRAVEELWGWAYSLCFYLRRLECLTICRCHNKGSTLSSVISRPWVLVQAGFECLPNWANRVAVWNATHLETFMHLIIAFVSLTASFLIQTMIPIAHYFINSCKLFFIDNEKMWQEKIDFDHSWHSRLKQLENLFSFIFIYSCWRCRSFRGIKTGTGDPHPWRHPILPWLYRHSR